MSNFLRYTTPRGDSWPEQRKAALIRDGYTCRICKLKQQKGLHVHHIIPFRCFESFEDANNLKNLITLCAACHAKEEIKVRKKRYPSAKNYVPPPAFHDSDWPKARKLALTRDNFICRHCKKSGTSSLHVHHIIPARAAGSGRHDTDNLITLCAPCHAVAERVSRLAFPPDSNWRSPRERLARDVTYNMVSQSFKKTIRKTVLEKAISAAVAEARLLDVQEIINHLGPDFVPKNRRYLLK